MMEIAIYIAKGKGWESSCLFSRSKRQNDLRKLRPQGGLGSDHPPGGRAGGEGGSYRAQTDRAAFVMVSTTHWPVYKVTNTLMNLTKLVPHSHLQPEWKLYPRDLLFRCAPCIQGTCHHSTNYLLSTYYVLGTSLGGSNTMINKTDSLPSWNV